MLLNKFRRDFQLFVENFLPGLCGTLCRRLAAVLFCCLHIWFTFLMSLQQISKIELRKENVKFCGVDYKIFN